jgi:hypothetical protein
MSGIPLTLRAAVSTRLSHQEETADLRRRGPWGEGLKTDTPS